MSKLRRILSWLALVVCFAVLCVFLWRNVTDLLDSDMASDMIYADLLRQEGSFLSSNWYYSSEIRILSNHLFFTPLFYLTQDWHLVRFLGTALSYVLLLLSLWTVTRQVGLRRWFPLIGAALLLPLSIAYTHYSLVGTFYMPHHILAFFLFALTLSQSAPCTPRARALRLVVLSALSVAAGLCGYRFLYLFFLPMAMAAAYLRMRHGPVARVARLLSGSLLSLGMALVGLVLNLFVLARLYSFDSYGSIAFIDFSFDRIAGFLSQLPTLLGYPTGQPILSAYLAPAALSLALLALLGWSVAAALRAPRGALAQDAPATPGAPPSFGEQTLALFAGSGLLLYLALLALTDLELAASPYHFLPVLVLCVPLAAWRFERLPMRPRLPVRAVAAGLLACLVAVSSAINYRYFSRRDITYEQRMLLSALSEEGYTTGYSTFWLGNILTELSDGQVEMYVFKAPLDTADDLINRMDPWLQRKSHMQERPEGRVFILFSKYYEETDFPLFAQMDPSHVIYESPYLLAYGYQSFDDLYADASAPS